jgi:hypothetical protein
VYDKDTQLGLFSQTLPLGFIIDCLELELDIPLEFLDTVAGIQLCKEKGNMWKWTYINVLRVSSTSSTTRIFRPSKPPWL